MRRREFLGFAAALAACARPDEGASMPRRPLGRTGRDVALFGLGGQAAIERADRDAALRIIDRALALGVDYFDTAPKYGPSQDYLGEALDGRRDQVFLASKTHDRTRGGAWRHLEESLRWLRTGRLDLWQLHELQTLEELDVIFGPDGAFEAMVEAREQKLVGALGITGHFDPGVLEEALRRARFDCLLVALNAADRVRHPVQRTLLPLAVEQGVGVIAMKVPGKGGLIRGALTMGEALGYVWSLPVATAIVGCDSVEQLEANVALARSFRALDESERAKLESRAALVFEQAIFFRRR